MSDTTSQNKRILAYMKWNGSITPLEALNSIGCMRLSARIAELRKQGFNIVTMTETKNGKRYARYWMLEEEKENNE